jgi:hypothetical protein
MIYYPKPKIPSNMEPYFEFLCAAVEQAIEDIENERPGSKHFESAVAWLLYGQGYEYCTAILNYPEDMRKHYEPIIDKRRDDAESRGNGCRSIPLS